MDVRFVVCIDFENVPSLEAAYSALRAQLPKAMSYETTDEFFVNGELGIAEDLQAARLVVLAAEDEGSKQL